MVRITDRPQGLKGRDGGSDREDRFVSRSFKRAAAVAAIVLASLVAPSSAKGFGMVGGLLLQPRAVDTEAASRSNVNDYFQNGFGHNRMSEDGIRQLRLDIGTGAQRFATSQPLMEFALGLFTLSERSQGLRVSQTALQGSGLQRVYAQLT